MGWVKVAGAWRPIFEAFKSIKYTGHCNGPATSNSYQYETISNKTLVIQAGDKLVYEMQPFGPTIATGLDGAVFQNNTFVNSLRDFTNPSSGKALVDQNGASLHPGRSNFTAGVWKYRTFDLTPVVGYTLGPWSLAFEGDAIGDYITYFRDIKIVDANGNTRLSIFDKTLDVTAQTNYQYGGVANYSTIAKSVVASPL